MKQEHVVLFAAAFAGAVSLCRAESLQSTLDARRSSFNAKAPEDVKNVYEAGVEAVALSGILESAKQKGDQAPDFQLTNAAGKKVGLSEYLQEGPVVLIWYRGGWCPYCNLTLHAMQQELPDFKAAGASLLALTPELPDRSMSTAEKQKLEFEVLSDLNNEVARKYGVVFRLTDEVAAIYEEKFGLSAYNGTDSNELPLAAAYVINTDGEIVYAFLDADYRNRAEPSEITEVLKSL